MAFNQAIELEGDVPARFLALAKAEEKLGNYKKAIDALENAYELDPKITILRQILSIHEEVGDTEATAATAARIEEQIARDEEVKKKRKIASMRRSMMTRGLANRKVKNPVKAVPNQKKELNKKTAKAPAKILKTHVGRKRI